MEITRRMKENLLISNFLKTFYVEDDTSLFSSKEKEAKEYFSNELSSMNSQFGFVVNLKESTLEYSSGIEKSLGLTEDNITFLNILRCIHQDDQEAICKSIQHAYTHLTLHNETTPLEAQLSLTFRIKNSNNVYMHVQNCISVLASNKDGKILKVISLFSDLSPLPFSNITVSLTCKCNVLKDTFVLSNDTFNKKYEDILSEREIEVAQFMINNMKTKEISHILGISKNTVGNHRSNILNKLGIHKSSELKLLV